MKVKYVFGTMALITAPFSPIVSTMYTLFFLHSNYKERQIMQAGVDCMAKLIKEEHPGMLALIKNIEKREDPANLKTKS